MYGCVPTIGNSHIKSEHHSFSKEKRQSVKFVYVCEWKCEKLEYNFACQYYYYSSSNLARSIEPLNTRNRIFHRLFFC